mmetsp:Transcript_36501/g.65296  ORF Transcript_36501/g.65296 Transcript_36501/m.65296 type:complete len:98 (-) Transcript_36501:67-360(-)
MLFISCAAVRAIPSFQVVCFCDPMECTAHDHPSEMSISYCNSCMQVHCTQEKVVNDSRRIICMQEIRSPPEITQPCLDVPPHLNSPPDSSLGVCVCA